MCRFCHDCCPPRGLRNWTFHPAEEPSGLESASKSSTDSGAILSRDFHTYKYLMSYTFDALAFSRAVVRNSQGAYVNVLSHRILRPLVARPAGTCCIWEGIAWRCSGANIIHYHICVFWSCGRLLCQGLSFRLRLESCWMENFV